MPTAPTTDKANAANYNDVRPYALFPTCETTMLRLLVLLLVSALSACSNVPHAFRLYYGNNPAVLRKMSENDGHAVLVVDSRALTTPQQDDLLRRAQQHGHIALGYISIGELASSDRARAEKLVGSLQNTLLNWNEKFGSWRVDVAQTEWQQWLHIELQRIAAAGYTGFFLDTPDTVDNYISNPQWNRQQRGEKVRAMVALIRSIKQQYPQHFVLLNRGLNLVNEHVWMDELGNDTEQGLALMTARADNPDAILYENAFASRDPWSLRIEADLQATAKTGRTQVFALGYADTFGDREAFFLRAQKTGFVAAWANSSTDLHQQPTQSP